MVNAKLILFFKIFDKEACVENKFETKLHDSTRLKPFAYDAENIFYHGTDPLWC